MKVAANSSNLYVYGFILGKIMWTPGLDLPVIILKKYVSFS